MSSFGSYSKIRFCMIGEEMLKEKISDTLLEILTERLVKQLPVVWHGVGNPEITVVIDCIGAVDCIGEIGCIGVIVAGYVHEQTEDISETKEHTLI
jgi:hypothetical protein